MNSPIDPLFVTSYLSHDRDGYGYHQFEFVCPSVVPGTIILIEETYGGPILTISVAVSGVDDAEMFKTLELTPSETISWRYLHADHT